VGKRGQWREELGETNITVATRRPGKTKTWGGHLVSGEKGTEQRIERGRAKTRG